MTNRINTRKKMKKKKNMMVTVCLVILLVIISSVAIVLIRNIYQNRDEKVTDLPTIDLNGKNPDELTWEEYMELSDEEKMIFPDYFESLDEYKKWYASNEPVIEENIEDIFTLDLKGKEPTEFTWEEYNNLTDEERAMFPDYFESYDEFNEWMETNTPEIEEVMTLDLQGKVPEEITWEEYMSWTDAERNEFPDYFDSYDHFGQWLEKNEP